MLSDTTLQELLDYTSTDPILSVYLNTDLTRGNKDQFKLNLRTLLREVDMPEDEAAILEYYGQDSRRTGRSVAMFSCAAQSYFRAFPFALSVRNLVFVGNQPYVKPLADLLDAYGSYGAALVDKEGARVFYFHLGELVEEESTLGQEVRHTKRGGASTFPGRRGGTAGVTGYMEETVERNIKDSVEFATRFFEKNSIRHVLIGGTDENTSQFQSHLPKAWQKLVIGTFAMSMSAGVAEVREKTLEIGEQADRHRETRLVEEMITAAAKGAQGVVRLEDTLGAMREGRIQTLVVQDGYRAPGFQCQGCGYLTTQKLATCPFCGKSFSEIKDAVELAVREVMKTGGTVEVVRDIPEMEKLGIGGLLRY